MSLVEFQKLLASIISGFVPRKVPWQTSLVAYQQTLEIIYFYLSKNQVETALRVTVVAKYSPTSITETSI